jgi:hypothetical protein
VRESGGSVTAAALLDDIVRRVCERTGADPIEVRDCCAHSLQVYLADIDAANEEPLSAADAARLKREAAEYEEQERAERERAYEMHLRDVQRGVA